MDLAEVSNFLVVGRALLVVDATVLFRLLLVGLDLALGLLWPNRF